MAYDLTGKVLQIGDEQVFGSGFKKKELVVTVEDGKYPQDINLEFVQDSVSKLDAVNVGDDVKVTFDIRGREYNGRYFNNLQAWKLDVVSSAGGGSGSPSVPDKDVPADFDEYDSDVPF